MKIAYNPLSSLALTAAPAGNDITFDLPGINIYVRGVRFKGTDTTYNVFKKHTSSGSGGYNGLVPVPSHTTTSVRYLREDGTWQVPIPQVISSTYTQLSNEDFNSLREEGRWYFISGSSTTTNGPTGVNNGAELYIGRNASGYRYLKVITALGIVWFRYWNSTAWTSWTRWYTDANTDKSVLLAVSTTANFRPLIIGYTNSSDPAVLTSTVTNQVYTANALYAQPSTGTLFANKFKGDLIGNADTSTSLGNTNVGNAALPVYFVSGKPIACTASSLFSLLTNDSNLLSITISGLNRKLTIAYATESNVATYLKSNDTRSVNNTPALFASSARFEFKQNSVDGLSDGGSYHGILHFKPYGGTTNFSGGQVSLLAFTDNSNLYLRTSTSSTVWGAWLKMLHTGNSSLTSTANDVTIKINNVSATVPLKSYLDGGFVTLNTALTITGVKTFTTLLRFTVALGTSPFTVTSTTLVSNLNSDLLDGYHLSDILPITAYHYDLGVLVTTDISSASNSMVTVNISGNSYGNRTINTIVQFYNYESGNAIINSSATHFGFNFGTIQAFNYNGKVCLWFKLTNSYQSFITIVRVTNSATLYNRVVSVANTTVPTSGVTRLITITPSLGAYLDSNVASATILLNTRTIWGQPFNGSANVAGSLSGATTITCSSYVRAAGELQSTSANSLRIVNGNYGVFWRNDGSNHYLMTTASGDLYGSYNSLRPFYFNLSTGRVNMGHGLSVAGDVTSSVGFTKGGSSNSYVLLGGGGHKLLSDLQGEYDGRYVNITGDIMTGPLTSPGFTANASSGPHFTGISAAGNWAYMRLNNSVNYWDLATISTRTQFEIRYNGLDTNAYIFSSAGVLTSTAFVKRGGTASLLLRADGGVATFNWSGQGGQPSWLWGGNAQHTYYVYNPSNFNVNSAITATKLQTSRTIFGRPFDGTANVAGLAFVYGNSVSAGSGYSNGALLIREAGLVGNALTTDQYAPRIGFHWANRLGYSIIANSGYFKLLAQNEVDLVDLYAKNVYANLIGTARYVDWGFSATFTSSWDCNTPNRVVYSDYGSAGRVITNAPSGWQYGTLLELGHTNYRGLNGSLNIQLMWDIAHNTTNGGTLWFRGKDSLKGWAKNWCKVVTDLNYTSVLDNRYVTSLGTSGDYLTWTRNGVVNNLTVPYSTRSGYLYPIASNPDNSRGTGYGARVFYSWNTGLANNSTTGFSNGITIGSHPSDAAYGFLIVLNMWDDRTYTRRYNSGWQAWKTLAWTTDVKDPANYYWANIKVSASSSTATLPTFNTCYTSNWFRSTGSTGWYSQTYGGGWYMSDSTWIRTYGSKSVYQDTGLIRTDGYLVTNGGLTAGATSPNNGTYKLHVTGASWSSGLIRAGGGFYHNSVNSNSYVLLAGGSYKNLSDFAKGNAGSATKGVYVTGGTVTAMTYSLSANLNSGTAGKLATYSSGTTVAAYNSTVGDSNRGIYMSAGVPTVMTYYLNSTVNSGTSGKLAYYSSATVVAADTSTVGSVHSPVYINAGVPTICGYSFKGSSRLPIVLLSGVFYRSGTTWYMDSARTHKVVDATPSITISGARMLITLPGTTISSGVVTLEQTTAFSASSTVAVNEHGNGAYGFAVYSGAADYVYVRTWCQRNDKNHSWASNGASWTTFLIRIQVTLFGYIN